MQAITTKYLPATNTRPSRIKASCDRGSITIPYPHELGQGEPAHAEAARQLITKFVTEDRAQYGSKPGATGWELPFVSGGLDNGTWAHVFVTPQR